MSLAITVVWGGEWAVGQRLTPSLLNGIFQNAQFQISGSIATASMPPGGIDSAWIGNTFITGLTATTPAAGDVLLLFDISAGAHRKATVADVLALGLTGLSTATTIAPTDYALADIGGAQKKVTVRELGKATSANDFSDTTEATPGRLALTDKVVVSKSGTRSVATVSQLLDAMYTFDPLSASAFDPANDHLVAITAAGVPKRLVPAAVRGGISAFINFDGRSELHAYIPGQNLGENLTAETVTLAAGHGIPTGEVRQGWWTTAVPLTSTPAMEVDKPYWIRAISGNVIAFYVSKLDALADANRINLTADSGETGWRFYFWTVDPTINSGGTNGVNGVVVLERNVRKDVGNYGMYRIFWKKQTTLANPCVTANAKWFANDLGVIMADVRVCNNTYAEVWGIGANGDRFESAPTNVMMQDA
jgi:hypothetical protein